MKRLEVEPELRTGIQSLCEKPCGLRRHAALATNYFVDPLYRYTNMRGKCYLRDAKWLEELPLEYFTRV